MPTAVLAAETLPEQIAAEPAAVSATQVVRRYGEGDTAVDASGTSPSRRPSRCSPRCSR